MMYDFMREIRLDILATMASGDETLAYLLNRSDNPEHRKLANSMMDNSNEVKRLFREKLSGTERDLYLLKAEGHYTPPGLEKELG